MADRNPDFGPPLAGAICAECMETTHLDVCAVCHRTVCSKHRSGLGSVSDGYTCMKSDCLLFGFGGAPIRKSEASYIRQRPGMWQRRHPVLVLVFGLFLVLGLTLMVYARYL